LVVKDAIKENIGYSPTDLDILEMLMWFELQKEYNPQRRELRQDNYSVDALN
jgi:hypothetical protein